MAHFDDSAALNITKDELRALLAFASTDDTRPHMCVVRVEPATNAVVTTDGHTCAKLRTDGLVAPASTLGYSVPRDALKPALKLCGKGQHIVIWRTDEKHLRIAVKRDAGEVSYLSPEVVVGEPHFPPVDQVIPSPDLHVDSTPIVGFDATYMARLLLVQKAAGKYAKTALRMPEDVLDPLRFDCDAWTIVIMPKRLDSIDEEAFKSVKAQRAARKAAATKASKRGKAA